jgi:hypothetical protein
LTSSLDSRGGFRADWIALLSACLAYVAIYAWFYPPIHNLSDEVGYLNQAYIWSSGSLTAEGAGYDPAVLGGLIEVDGKHVPWRNPGRGLTLIPFLKLFGYSGVFASGALIHLLVVGISALCLRRLGVSPLWAVLILLHPTLALYSRYVMADELAALGLTTAFYALIASRQPGLWAGLALGLTAVVRSQTAIVLPFVALSVRWLPIQDRLRQSVLCVIAAGSIGVALLLYNAAVFNNPIGMVPGDFGLEYFPKNIRFYGLALLLIWPGMGISLFLRFRHAAVIRMLCLPPLALTLFWYFYQTRSSGSGIQTLVLGQRLIQPILPLLVIGYALVLHDRLLPALRRAVAPRLRHAAVAMGCIGLLLGVALVAQRHQRHLSELERPKSVVQGLVPEGSLIVANRMLRKQFSVGRKDLREYRWASYDGYDQHTEQPTRTDTAIAAAETGPWYLAYVPRHADGKPVEEFLAYLREYPAQAIDTKEPRLLHYRMGPRPVDRLVDYTKRRDTDGVPRAPSQ